jgi:hypothetical protein
MMKRTQIQVPELKFRRLAQAARHQGRSLADCIREGIRLFLDRADGDDVEIGRIAGKFRPLPRPKLKPHDQWVVEAIEDAKGKRRP